MIEDLDKAFAKYRGAYHIGSKSKISEARKRKEQRKKSKNRRLNASNNRRKRACIILSLLRLLTLARACTPLTDLKKKIESVFVAPAPISLRFLCALAHLYYFAGPTKTAMLRRLQSMLKVNG